MRKIFALLLLFSIPFLSGCVSGRTYAKDALIAEARGEHDKAIELNTKAIEAGDLRLQEVSIMYANRGNIYLKKGMIDKAIDDYDDSLSHHPYYANAYYGRGNAYSMKGEYKNAIEDYDGAVSHNPSFVKAFWERGNAYVGSGNIKRGMDDFNKAIAIGSKNANYHIVRGIFLAELSDIKGAREDFSEARRLNKKSGAPSMMEGGILFAKGNFNSAYEKFSESIKKDSLKVNVYLWQYLAKLREGASISIFDYIDKEWLEDEWIEAVAKTHSGQMRPEDLLLRVKGKSKKDVRKMKSESFFHIAQFYLAKGDNENGISYLKKCRDTGVRGTLESVSAYMELQRLGK